MKKFKAVFNPDPDGAWNVSIPAVDGCHTWGRSISEARKNIREALEVALEDDRRAKIARDAEIQEEFLLPKSALRRLEVVRSLRKEAARVLAKKHDAEVLAAIVLRESSLSYRDAGALLALSQEGVRKLVGK